MLSEEIILFVSEYEDSDYVPTRIKETPILILDVDAACDDETDSLREFLVALSDHGFTIKTKGMWCNLLISNEFADFSLSQQQQQQYFYD